MPTQALRTPPEAHVAVLKVGPTHRVFPGDVKIQRGGIVRWHNLEFDRITVRVGELRAAGFGSARRGGSVALRMDLTRHHYYTYTVVADGKRCSGNSSPGIIIK